MLTGDNEASADAVAKAINIKNVRANLLPDGKAEIVKELLQRYGSVAMLGDGVNDAPSLALASVGFTMGNLSSDIAVDASSVVLLNENLSLIPFLIRLGKKTLNVIKANITASIAIKAIFILLALLGMSNLALAIFADVGVTILVILNSLRLMRFEKKDPAPI